MSNDGIIDELGTRITTTIITDELESLKDVFDESNEFTLTIDSIVNKLKSLEPVVTEDVSNALKEQMESVLKAKDFKNKTGKLADSIEVEQTGNTAEVGPTARSNLGFPYPMSIEFGRREVRPVNASVLRWIDNGMTVFSKYSRSVAPDPFVDESIARTLLDVEDRVKKVIMI